MAKVSGARLGESLENYLEAIWTLQREWGVARVGHISRRLAVSKPSVTGALRTLREKKLVRYEPYGIVTLTATGKRIAAEVSRRHGVLKSFLTGVLLLPEKSAEEAACRMEHILSDAVIERFCAFAQYIEHCPRGTPVWTSRARFTCPSYDTYPECEHCSVTGATTGIGPEGAKRTKTPIRKVGA